MLPTKPTILDRITTTDYTALMRFVMQHTGRSVEEAQDAVQETFWIALEKQGQLRDESCLLPWLQTIAKRTAFKQSRYYLSLILVSTDDLEKIEGDDNVENVIQRREQFETVARALNRLAPVYRSILQMRYEENCTFTEIAEKSGMSAATVRSYHRRALKRLRKALNHL